MELEIRKAEPEPEPSNAHDLERLQFLPYLDVFFTDARIGTYLRSVLRRDGVPTALATGSAAVVRWAANEIAALEAALGERDRGR